MIISLIVATTQNGVIGNKGEIPWYLPADLVHFKKTTMGHPILMGRKTHESIGRALPGRTNIVITRQKDYSADGCVIAGSLEQAIEAAKDAKGSEEIFIIGGAEIYKLAMPLINRLYLTKVHTTIEGDKFFEYDPNEWKEISREEHPADEENKYAFELTQQIRKL